MTKGKSYVVLYKEREGRGREGWNAPCIEYHLLGDILCMTTLPTAQILSAQLGLNITAAHRGVVCVRHREKAYTSISTETVETLIKNKFPQSSEAKNISVFK